MDFYDLTAYLALTLVLAGVIYRYIYRKSKIKSVNLLFLFGVSFVTAIGVSYIIGYFDFMYNEASLFGFDQTSLKLPALFGAGGILFFAVWQYIVFVKQASRRGG